MAHSIAANPGDWANAQAFADILPAHMEGPHGSHLLQMRHGGRGALTRLLTLHLWLSPLDAGLVARQLPPWLLLRPQQQPLMASLGAAMELLVQDSLVQKPGWQLSAARMGDLLLLHLLGEHWRSQPAPDGSLADPGIARAVSAMQAEPQHPWTLQTLAQLACMSRTVFTGRFRQLLGVPPMQYLASYRMQRAAELLRKRKSRRAILDDLHAKGIDRGAAAEAVEALFAQSEEDEEENPELANARALVERHYAAKLAQGKWQQVAAALARRGFSHSVIRQALADAETEETEA